MTLRDDLGTLLSDAGIDDVDIDEAVADEHVRSAAYQTIVKDVAAHSEQEARRVVSVIVRDPVEIVAKTAIVALIDEKAICCDDAGELRRWAESLSAEFAQLKSEKNRLFIQQRIHDWATYLAIEAGHSPSSADVSDMSDWMQRLIAESSHSMAAVEAIGEFGRTKKIRNIAENRATSRSVRSDEGGE